MNRDEESTPIINYIFNWDKDEINQYIFELMELEQKRSPSVKFHKKVLGKQNYKFNKYYVWESENWRVYCSDEGTNLEVRINLTKEQVKEVWNEYKITLGLI